MNLRKSVDSVDRRLPDYPQGKVSTNEHMADGYGEWIRHPLFGLWTRSCLVSINREVREEEECTEKQALRPLWQIERERQKEREISSFGDQRGVSMPISPYNGVLGEDKSSFSRLYVVVFLVPQCYEMNVFIIYVNFSASSSGIPVRKARVRIVLHNISFTGIFDASFVLIFFTMIAYFDNKFLIQVSIFTG